MTISADLITRYTSEVDVDWREALAFNHPLAGDRYIINHHEEHQGYFGTSLKIFQPVAFEVVLPTRDSSGRQDMSINLANVLGGPQAFLEAAIVDGTRPIVCAYSVFILGSPTAQVDPWIYFNLTDIALTEEALTATATRADVINRTFPSMVYRTDRYPGLVRR